jgi:hypothetical protein
MKEFFETWASIYANHAALRTTVAFVHVGGLLVGGGCAVAADLAVISATPTLLPRAEFQPSAQTHRLIFAGLAALSISGLLLFAADVDTFWHSRVFWLKMALVVVLLANGTLLLIAERQVRLGHPRGLVRFRNTALVSLVLWLLTTLAGAALPNIG